MERKQWSRFEKYNPSQGTVIIITLVLLLPLLFLGTRTSHDWGDDFAQYIHQAANIVQGIPQSETGFVYSQENYIGPQAYPVGFPLLLAPIYAVAGNNMVAFTTWISILYILTGLLMVLFYRQTFSWITALVLALIFVYNPQMIIFKREVMSDIPFTALLVLNFILYSKTKNGQFKNMMVLALGISLMLIVRPAGVVFIAAIAMHQLTLFYRRKLITKKFVLMALGYFLIPVALYFLINSLVFKIPSGGSIRDYLLFYDSGNLLKIIPENFVHHLEVFRYMYTPGIGVLKGFSLLMGSIMVVSTLIGFIQRLMNGPGVVDWFFIFYVLMLLVFPNNDSAFRLMVPLGFIFLFYSATGLKSISFGAGISSTKKAIAFGSVMLLLFLPGLISIARSGQNVLPGPQEKSAIETFGFISRNIPDSATVVFAKPRALALYAGCKSMVDPMTKDPTHLHNQVTEAKATYLLIHNTLTNEPLKRYVRVMGNRLTPLLKNEEFILYRINPVNPAAHR